MLFLECVVLHVYTLCYPSGRKEKRDTMMTKIKKDEEYGDDVEQRAELQPTS